MYAVFLPKGVNTEEKNTELKISKNFILQINIPNRGGCIIHAIYIPARSLIPVILVDACVIYHRMLGRPIIPLIRLLIFVTPMGKDAVNKDIYELLRMYVLQPDVKDCIESSDLILIIWGPRVWLQGGLAIKLILGLKAVRLCSMALKEVTALEIKLEDYMNVLLEGKHFKAA